MIKVVVQQIAEEALGIRSFLLAREDGQPFAPYDPGAHIDVTGPTGVTRQYSLCNHPSRAGALQIAVKKEPASRGGSSALHEQVQEGGALLVSEPRNLFHLDTGHGDYALCAAGIGVTPLLSMAYRLQELGKSFRLHYFARSRDHGAFIDQIEASEFADRLDLRLGVEPADLEAALQDCLAGHGASAAVYTCGPGPFMDCVVKVASRDRDPALIHLEHFAATDTSALPSAAFDVTLKRSGKQVHVPAEVALTEALVKAGITVHTSCKEGVCGTCILPVLEGEPDHRDNCLTESEKQAGDLICACVSRARGPCLVLDL